VFRSKYHCRDCGGSDAYRSRRRTLIERYVLPFLLLKPVRCVKCFRKTYVSVFVAARDRDALGRRGFQVFARGSTLAVRPHHSSH
jgi:hypothetical protein